MYTLTLIAHGMGVPFFLVYIWTTSVLIFFFSFPLSIHPHGKVAYRALTRPERNEKKLVPLPMRAGNHPMMPDIDRFPVAEVFQVFPQLRQGLRLAL